MQMTVAFSLVETLGDRSSSRQAPGLPPCHAGTFMRHTVVQIAGGVGAPSAPERKFKDQSVHGRTEDSACVSPMFAVTRMLQASRPPFKCTLRAVRGQRGRAEMRQLCSVKCVKVSMGHTELTDNQAWKGQTHFSEGSPSSLATQCSTARPTTSVKNIRLERLSSCTVLCRTVQLGPRKRRAASRVRTCVYICLTRNISGGEAKEFQTAVSHRGCQH